MAWQCSGFTVEQTCQLSIAKWSIAAYNIPEYLITKFYYGTVTAYKIYNQTRNLRK